MKKLFEEDLSIGELKSMVKRLNKKANGHYVLLGALGILVLLGVIALVVMKLRCCGLFEDDYDDYDDYDDDDDNESCSCSEKDFED